MTIKTALAIAIAVSSLAGINPVFAAGDHSGGHDDNHAEGMDDHAHMMDMSIGEPGDPDNAGRVVQITMTDNAFSIPELDVSEGEVIRFEITNAGEFVHEFNIGSAEMHAEHQEEMNHMVANGEMDVFHVDPDGHHHGGGNTILLNPGDSGTLTWVFGAAGHLEFACNVPGHYQSGMVGPIHVN